MELNPSKVLTDRTLKGYLDLYLAIATGQVVDTDYGHKFGYHPATTTSKTTVWDVGTLYSYLTAATTLKLSSSSADDAAAGTGARVVTIYGLDADFNEIQEDLGLNGQTAVSTVKEYLRVYRVAVITAGSGSENAGDIYIGNGTVTAGVPADKYAKISTGNNQTLMAMMTVPAGKRMIIPQWYANVGQGKECVIDAVVRDANNGNIFQLKQRRMLYQNGLTMPQEVPFVFEEKHDLEIRVFSSVGGVEVAAGFDYIMIDADA